MNEKKEFLEGYRKIIYFVIGVGLLVFMVWKKSDPATISAVMMGYSMMGGVFIGGNEMKKLVESKYKPGEQR